MTAAAAMWQPDEMAVGQVVTMLDQAGVPDTAVQAAVKAQLDQLQTVPEFNRTVAHVFIRLTDRPVAMRMAAGLILKNNVRCHSQTKKVKPQLKKPLVPQPHFQLMQM